MEYRISLTGDIGSGKSTVCNLLVEKCAARKYSSGAKAREVALSLGIDISQQNKVMNSDPRMDLELDNALKQLSFEPGNLIVDSRLAWNFVQGTFKVYFTVDPAEAGRRIFNEKRSSESFDSAEETMRRGLERRADEKTRYLKLYGVDCDDMNNYDIVIDTTAASPEIIADTVVESYAKWSAGQPYARHYVYAGRMRPLCDFDGGSADIRLTEYNAAFYITSGVDAALDSLKNGRPFEPCEVTFYHNMTAQQQAEFERLIDSLDCRRRLDEWRGLTAPLSAKTFF